MQYSSIISTFRTSLLREVKTGTESIKLTQYLSKVRVTRSLVFYVVFCKSLFVLCLFSIGHCIVCPLSFFYWPLYCLAFVFFYWPLYCLAFFGLRLLIIFKLFLSYVCFVLKANFNNDFSYIVAIRLINVPVENN